MFLCLKHFNSIVPPKPQIVLYYISCLIFIAIELYEANIAETHLIEIAEYSLSFIFIFYILASFYVLNKLEVSKAIQWPLYFLLASLLIFYIIDLVQFLFDEQSLLNFNSILIFEVSLLFYYLTFILVFNNNFLDLPLQNSKYKNSSLNPNDVETYKKRISDSMEINKFFTKENLSLQTFSNLVSIPRHYISDILNVYLKTNFQDFVNEYRVEEFIKLNFTTDNDHFTILGIASSAGFKKKATFNSNFKKFRGVSPTEYKHIVKK